MRMSYDWAAEFNSMYPGLQAKERKAVINKLLKLIKEMGSKPDAAM